MVFQASLSLRKLINMPKTQTTKPASVKTAKTAKPAKKAVVAESKAPTKVSSEAITLPLYTAVGEYAGTVEVSKQVFGAELYKTLMDQAVRVYLANQREGSAHSKTRSEVHGSSKKIYKQKGTGRARHGTIRAPIFVKGGVAHGPRAHDFSLTMPKVMANKAVMSALTKQAQAKKIVVIDGFASVEPKTKVISNLFKALPAAKRVLVVTVKKDSLVSRISRNIHGVTTMPAIDIHTYEVLRNGLIVIDKRALDEIQKRLIGETV